ncbi:MAG: lantibiotic dehydratase, partial [Gemmatimonadales bacterium]
RAARETISVALHALIGNCEDKRRRRILVDVRRRLYNGRALTSAQTRMLMEEPDAPVKAALVLLDQARGKADTTVLAYARAYVDRQASERRMLRAVVDDDALARGIALSSESLFRALTKITRGSGAGRSARDAQTERGLLRYATRMIMKATPIGTLCNVIPVRSSDVAVDEPPVLAGCASNGRTVSRLNKTLYGAVWRALRGRPDVRAALRVRTAPTLKRVGDEYVALAAINQHEVFQRVHATPLLEEVVRIVDSRRDITVARLTHAIVGEGRVDATPDQVAVYVDKLIDLGLIQVCSVVREHDADWDVPLREFLASTDDAMANEAAGSLSKLRRALEQYQPASATERAALLSAMRSEIRELLRRLDLKADVRESILFEDATAQAECVLPVGPRLANAFDSVAVLSELLARVAPTRIEHATMRRFFDEQYAGRGCVPLIDFYHDYYRFSKKERLASGGESGSLSSAFNPYGLELATQLKAATMKLRALVISAWSAAPLAEEIGLEALA